MSWQQFSELINEPSVLALLFVTTFSVTYLILDLRGKG